MTTLYKIGAELAQKAAHIQELLEEGADPTSNGIQELLHDMVGTDDEWKSKATNVGKFLKHLEYEQSIIDAEVKRLQDKSKKLSKTYDSLHDILLAQMINFGVDEIKDPILGIKIKNNPLSVLVRDIDLLPEEYKRTKITVEDDKTKLKQDKPEIEGVEFVNTRKLVLK